MTTSSRYPWSLAIVAATLSFGTVGTIGCQSIAGIESRRLGPCGEYCDTVMASCKGTHATYATYEACMGVCQLLPEGNALEPAGTNTVACRLTEARAAAISEPDVHCLGAGPGGGSVCGSDCESYCLLYKAACGSNWYTYGTLEQCTESCQALRDRKAFDAVSDHDGDTLQCRLVHTSSATIEPATHCEHAVLAPPTAPCVDAQDAPPVCTHYCNVVSVACQGENAQYEDTSTEHTQCLAACKAFALGTNADEDINTVGCRTYHAYNALLAPGTHCSHAGPTGDGHCGKVNDTQNSICASYCKLVEPACPAEFAKTYPNGTCEQACTGLPGTSRDSHYTIDSGKAAGNSLDCRMLHTIQSLAGDATQCAAALGGNGCN